MADKSSIIINTTDRTGKEKSMSVGYINPNATPAELIEFAQGINNLTDNSYQNTTLVEKTELVNKPTPSLLIFDSGDGQKKPVTTFPFANATAAKNLEIETPSSGKVTVIKNTSTLWVRPFIFKQKRDGKLYNLILLDNASSEDMLDTAAGETYDNLSGERLGDTNAGEVIIHIAETAQYAAVTWTITITD